MAATATAAAAAFVRTACRSSTAAAIRSRSSLTHLLTAPSNVAHTLDWKKASGSLLSLRVNQNQNALDVAVASHPIFDEPTQQLPSIPLVCETNRNCSRNGRKFVSHSVADALQQIVANYNVCGVVVSWPVQPEGWCGASCGKVLHTLDQICLEDERPVCLYDSTHTVAPGDEWGRTELYSTVSDKPVHVASREQYPDCSEKVAALVCRDFMRDHWPHIVIPQDHQDVAYYNNEKDCYFKNATRNAEKHHHPYGHSTLISIPSNHRRLQQQKQKRLVVQNYQEQQHQPAPPVLWISDDYHNENAQLAACF